MEESSDALVREDHHRPRLALATVVVGTLLAFMLAGPALAGALRTTRVSVSSSGAQGNGDSVQPAISAHGRYVAFTSLATNLVRHSTPNASEVLIRDRKTGKTKRVSPRSFGDGDHPSISAHGRFVAFDSRLDVFVRDRRTGKTTRVTVGASTSPATRVSFNPSISADGRFVAFDSATSKPGACHVKYTSEVFVRDRQRRKARCVSVSSDGTPGGGRNPSISADGRFVAFTSRAPNMVANDTNQADDIFVRDRRTHHTQRVNVSSTGAQAEDQTGYTSGESESPWISADGRFVAFESEATNLVAGDTNNQRDVFVRDRKTHETERVSVGPAGVQANYDSGAPSISADGRFVAFGSSATNLVADDTNSQGGLFVYDRNTHQTRRESVSSANVPANSGAGGYISADGHWVALNSDASNLVPGDTNQCVDSTGDVYNCFDVFVRGPLP
jgi:Tol biopolymer transport system component